MDEPYQAIAEVVAELCSPGFQTAELKLRTADDFLSLELVCYLPGGTQEAPRVNALAASAIDDAVDELKANWPGEPFTRGVFHLSSDGSFKFDAIYDPA
jgi:hypothetical protein